jgi:hypothetical protein
MFLLLKSHIKGKTRETKPKASTDEEKRESRRKVTGLRKSQISLPRNPWEE